MAIITHGDLPFSRAWAISKIVTEEAGNRLDGFFFNHSIDRNVFRSKPFFTSMIRCFKGSKQIKSIRFSHLRSRSGPPVEAPGRLYFRPIFSILA
jgi:hypothetical protein